MSEIPPYSQERRKGSCCKKFVQAWFGNPRRGFPVEAANSKAENQKILLNELLRLRQREASLTTQGGLTMNENEKKTIAEEEELVGDDW